MKIATAALYSDSLVKFFIDLCNPNFVPKRVTGSGKKQHFNAVLHLLFKFVKDGSDHNFVPKGS